jgi:NhaP-type Na+/H+ or K+/H+ antiporter
MLLSISLILLSSLVLGELFQKISLPSLLGMVITGIILGPNLINLISTHILDISGELREIALVIILLRAGLALDLKDLRKIGRPAILMAFVPASFEIVAVTIFAPLFFEISYLEAALMGAVITAVSPAVIVPKMLKLMDEGYGRKKRIPQLIMAGASVDDILVIVIFTTLMGMVSGRGFSTVQLVAVPISVISGLVLGALCGILLVALFKRIHIRDTKKVIVILSASFVFLAIEDVLVSIIPVSGLLAVMALGITILKQYPKLASRLSSKFSKIWIGAEMFLFVLVGATVNLSFALTAGFAAIALIFIGLLFRTLAVNICLIGTNLNIKERIFTSIAYLPKATVQAAIGAIPFYAGVTSGNLILTLAVTAILITAPLGALGMDLTYTNFLTKDKQK